MGTRKRRRDAKKKRWGNWSLRLCAFASFFGVANADYADDVKKEQVFER
ncbi:hypothetical protein QUF72_18130 [Desulfobacterales bacterium HSG2]|nr:hypothetical protein [Desulfobacterales bacterium HSG2]